MRQGTFTPLKALYIQSIFQMFQYTPRGLMDKEVVSTLIGQEFKSWSQRSWAVVQREKKFMAYDLHPVLIPYLVSQNS